MNGFGNAIFGNWEIGTIVNGRSGLALEIGIVRPDVVIQCRNTAGCVVPSGAGGATTTFANGFSQAGGIYLVSISNVVQRASGKTVYVRH